MTIATAKNTPRNVYTATSSQTVFTIGFEFFNTADIKVFRNGTALTYNAAPVVWHSLVCKVQPMLVIAHMSLELEAQ